MQAGDLPHRVQIQQDQGTTKTGLGQPIPSWATIAWRYAKIEPLSGREYWDAQQVKSAVTHTVTFRHYEGLTTAMRLKFGTRVFNLGAVRNLEENGEWHVCKCIEMV